MLTPVRLRVKIDITMLMHNTPLDGTPTSERRRVTRGITTLTYDVHTREIDHAMFVLAK